MNTKLWSAPVFTLEFWFTVAIIIIFLEISLILLLLLAITGGLGYGSEVFRRKLKSWLPIAQYYADKGASLTRTYTGKAVMPAIQLRSRWVGWSHTVRVLLNRKP